jgi:hypothetical protein
MEEAAVDGDGAAPDKSGLAVAAAATFIWQLDGVPKIEGVLV